MSPTRPKSTQQHSCLGPCLRFLTSGIPRSPACSQFNPSEPNERLESHCLANERKQTFRCTGWRPSPSLWNSLLGNMRFGKIQSRWLGARGSKTSLSFMASLWNCHLDIWRSNTALRNLAYGHVDVCCICTRYLSLSLQYHSFLCRQCIF